MININFIQSFSEWILVYGVIGLFIVSFTEASFFLVPPDILLVGLSINNPKLALWYAFVTSLSSVLGAIFGYFIGVKAGRPILERIVKKDTITKTEKLFQEYGGWAVAIAGFTPIPFKVFTIGAGIFRISKTEFFVASLISRSTRFFFEGILIYFLGLKAKDFLGQYLNLITVGMVLVVFFLYIIFKNTEISRKLKHYWFRVKARIRHYYTDGFAKFGSFGNYLIGGLVFGLTFILVFAKFAEDLINKELDTFDAVIINAINSINTPLTTQFMKFLTRMGSPLVMIIIAIIVWVILLKYKKHFWDSLMVLVSLSGSFLMNEILKSIFHRDRPNIHQLVEVGGYSFPSGHSMVALSFYGILGYLLWINLAKRTSKFINVFITVFLIIGIGISRIYLGVHYPSDVLAGFAAGGVWLVGCILALETIRYYKSNPNNIKNPK